MKWWRTLNIWMSSLDLSRYFMGNFASGTGLISNIYWKDMNVEDTAIGSFRTNDGRLHLFFLLGDFYQDVFYRA